VTDKNQPIPATISNWRGKWWKDRISCRRRNSGRAVLAWQFADYCQVLRTR